MQLLLPSELKHRIAELSSHDSLASLARTHTAYQREAEQALYRTLSNPSLNCLETLATNSEKAGFVRFLAMPVGYFKFPYEKDHPSHQRATSYLLDALVNMHSLSDLRLRMPRYEVQPWMKSLDKILWSVYEHGSFDLLKLTAGDIVTIIFDYKLYAAMKLSTFLKSSEVKLNCRYLEYTSITTMKSGSWKLSNSFKILNYTSQLSSHWNAMATTQTLTVTELVSSRRSTLSIATLQFIKFWPNLSMKIKILIRYGWPMRSGSLRSPSI